MKFAERETYWRIRQGDVLKTLYFNNILIFKNIIKPIGCIMEGRKKQDQRRINEISSPTKLLA